MSAFAKYTEALLNSSTLSKHDLHECCLFWTDLPLEVVEETRADLIKRILTSVCQSRDPGEALKDLCLAAGVDEQLLRIFVESVLIMSDLSVETIAEFRLRWAARPFVTKSRTLLVTQLLSEARGCLDRDVYQHTLLDMIKLATHPRSPSAS